MRSILLSLTLLVGVSAYCGSFESISEKQVRNALDVVPTADVVNQAVLTSLLKDCGNNKVNVGAIDFESAESNLSQVSVYKDKRESELLKKVSCYSLAILLKLKDQETSSLETDVAGNLQILDLIAESNLEVRKTAADQSPFLEMRDALARPPKVRDLDYNNEVMHDLTSSKVLK